MRTSIEHMNAMRQRAKERRDGESSSVRIVMRSAAPRIDQDDPLAFYEERRMIARTICQNIDAKYEEGPHIRAIMEGYGDEIPF